MKKKYLIQIIDILEEIISIIQVSNPNPLYSGRSIADDVILKTYQQSSNIMMQQSLKI